jgi:hypothetical protein
MACPRLNFKFFRAATVFEQRVIAPKSGLTACPVKAANGAAANGGITALNARAFGFRRAAGAERG